jgi:predicted ATPase
VRELLAAIGPTILVLEDLHWADHATEELLGFLGPQLPPKLAPSLHVPARGSGRVLAAPEPARLPAGAAGISLTLYPLDSAQVRDLLDVAQISVTRAGGALSEALTSALVLEVGDGRYDFRQALARQAVEEAIASPMRRRLHLRAARALELASPKPVARLAHHYREAGKDEGMDPLSRRRRRIARSHPRTTQRRTSSSKRQSRYRSSRRAREREPAHAWRLLLDHERAATEEAPVPTG